MKRDAWECVMQRAACCAVLVSLAVFPIVAAAQRSAIRPDVPLPEPGQPIRNVLLDNCVSCHGIDDYAFYAKSREQWKEFIDTVHKRDTVRKKVKLSPGDEKVLLDYLASNFGPDFIPFPRDYVPEEISEFFSDADGRVFLEQRCSSCHSSDTVLKQRHGEKEWRQILVAERARIMSEPGAGDRRGRSKNITDEELEKMTEWLSRVRGVNE